MLSTTRCRIAVIGAGSWGSAVARLLAKNGHRVALWARRPELAEAINTTHHNPDYLKEVELSAGVEATADLSEALAGAAGIVVALPSFSVDQGCRDLPELPLLLLSKGFNADGRFLLEGRRQLAVLSGPNHAEEVARDINSATVIAAREPGLAEFWQDLLASPTFRVYSSRDVVGVQTCAAVKNIIAIACGAAAGIGGGDNTLAALITRGVAELARLAEALGGQSSTCMGLAGIGDLIATCLSKFSRNRSFGLALAQGASFKQYRAEHKMVVEGAYAAQVVPGLAAAHQVEMPICESIYEVVWQNKSIADAYQDIVSRPLKAEFL
ncbi:MAG: NAD(P)-dependent glycerol-3-phosphate dehydrogenase [Coriobacteriales bacterium]|nr:NAD(P)-dependent glycerol-3-phosphate dehydrogenase [Coriobacteriales bacterium]